MKTLFLVEAGGKYGLGHLARSAVLADALRARHAEAPFAVRRGAGQLPDWLLTGKVVSELDAPGAADALVAEHHPDWVVVDGYEMLADGVVQRMQACGRRVLAFDDLGTDGAGADLVVNQNLPVPVSAQRPARELLGPGYALVDSAYMANRTRDVATALQRVLITFGGSDLRGLTAHAVQVFGTLSDSLSLDVVVGPYHRTRSFAAPGVHNLTVHEAPHGLAALLATADLVVSAAGSTCWQVCCSGVPLIAVQTADNQREVIRTLAQTYAVTFSADAFLNLTGGFLAKLIDGLRDVNLRQRMVSAQRAAVDGNGAARIIDAMEQVNA